MDSSREQLEERAARWLHQRELGPWAELDEKSLAQWLENSTTNRIAFLRMEAAWAETGRLKALKLGYPPRTVPTPEQLELTSVLRGDTAIPNTVVGRQRRWTPMLVAAAVGAVMLMGGLLAYRIFSAERYSTPVGGLASVPLKDGSSMTLNTASQVRVKLDEKVRHVELTHGEAYFDVAQDPTRPFTVTAGNKTITAIGTAFSVRRDVQDVRVTVASGRVRIEGDGRAQTMSAGSIADAKRSGLSVQRRTVPELEDALSWRTGYVVFHDVALPEAIAEFNRYNPRKLILACRPADGNAQPQEPRDPCTIRLNGKFRSTNTDALVRLLEKSFQLSAQRSEGRILLAK